MRYKDFFVRPLDYISDLSREEYEEDIKSFGLSKDVIQLQNLFSDSFGHHVNPYLTALDSRLEMQDSDPKRLISSDNLSSFFIKNCYVDPTIYMTDSRNEIERKKLEVSINDFFDSVIANPVTSGGSLGDDLGSNRISYLIGDVGEGKSILVSKLINGAIKKKYDPKGYILVPIYVSIEDKPKDVSGKLPDIDDAFYAKLHQMTYEYIHRRKDLSE